jgi:hypothetical protein
LAGEEMMVSIARLREIRARGEEKKQSKDPPPINKNI